jgi:hypothetical protein
MDVLGANRFRVSKRYCGFSIQARVQYVAHLLAADPDAKRIQRIMRAASWPESIRDAEDDNWLVSANPHVRKAALTGL